MSSTACPWRSSWRRRATTALAPSEIEDHLGQRFRLLVSRRRVGDERHGSLQRVLDWSYELLKPDQQTFFVRLSIFAGRFDLEAAHQVCWPDDELAAIDTLDDLVAKSLLIAQRHGRRTSYLMLETMRQYSSQRLTPTERERLADRHAEFYADLGERSWDGIRGSTTKRGWHASTTTSTTFGRRSTMHSRKNKPTELRASWRGCSCTTTLGGYLRSLLGWNRPLPLQARRKPSSRPPRPTSSRVCPELSKPIAGRRSRGQRGARCQRSRRRLRCGPSG